MKYCLYCGAQNPDTANFCAFCTCSFAPPAPPSPVANGFHPGQMNQFPGAPPPTQQPPAPFLQPTQTVPQRSFVPPEQNISLGNESTKTDSIEPLPRIAKLGFWLPILLLLFLIVCILTAVFLPALR